MHLHVSKGKTRGSGYWKDQAVVTTCQKDSVSKGEAPAKTEDPRPAKLLDGAYIQGQLLWGCIDSVCAGGRGYL